MDCPTYQITDADIAMQISLKGCKTYQKKITSHPRSALGSSSMNWGHRCLPCNLPSETEAAPLHSWVWGKAGLNHTIVTEAIPEMKKILR